MESVKLSLFFEQQPAQWKIDLLMNDLAAQGFASFEEVDAILYAYAAKKDFDEKRTVDFLKNYDMNVGKSWEISYIEDRNWNKLWEEKYFKPLVIDDTVLVRAPFHTEFPQCRYRIVIEPNMAFGTGNHETTSLMISQMLKLNLKNKRVLDMGSGTGILAILASKLGARQITAIDIDEWAFEAIIENTKTNKAKNITAILGDSSSLGDACYDIILANIQKNIIINDLPVYASVLEPGGIMLLSGFYRNDLKDVKAVAKKLGLRFEKFVQKNNWVVAAFSSQELQF